MMTQQRQSQYTTLLLAVIAMMEMDVRQGGIMTTGTSIDEEVWLRLQEGILARVGTAIRDDIDEGELIMICKMKGVLLISLLVGLLCLNKTIAKMNVAALEQTPEDSLHVKNMPLDISKPVTTRKIAVVVEKKRVDRYGSGNFLEAELRDYLTKSGFVIVERNEMERLLKEQYFQLTGAVSDENAVQLGKIAEVTDFLFANITSVTQDEKYKEGGLKYDKNGNLIGSYKDEWEYTEKVSVDFRIVNVESGQTVVNISQTSYGIKSTEKQGSVSENDLINSAISNAIYDAIPKFQEAFPLSGYTIAMKGNRKAVMINIGKEHGVTEDRKFNVFETSEFSDATGKKHIEKKPITTLTVFQVEEQTSWAKPSDRKNILIGQIVEAIPESRSLGHELLKGLKDIWK